MIIRGRDYEHTLAMPTDGAAPIRYEITELAPMVLSILKGEPFDAAEFSLAGYMMLRDRAATAFTAIPVFPARSFFHACLWVRARSDLRTFADLRGKRIALRDYTSTTSVWFRGDLKASHGVDWADIRWVVGPNRRFPPPAEADITVADGDLEDMLAAGDVDAFFSVRVRDETRPAPQRVLRPLLADPVGAEAAYLAETGRFPLLHVVLVSHAAAALDPAGPRAIFDLYEAAKRAALKRRLGATFLPWGERDWAAKMDLVGGDPLPYGLTEANVAAIATLAGYLHDQKLIRTLPGIDGLFWPGSTGWP